MTDKRTIRPDDDELSVDELEQAAGGAYNADVVADNTNCGEGNCNCGSGGLT